MAEASALSKGQNHPQGVPHLATLHAIVCHTRPLRSRCVPHPATRNQPMGESGGLLKNRFSCYALPGCTLSVCHTRPLSTRQYWLEYEPVLARFLVLLRAADAMCHSSARPKQQACEEHDVPHTGIVGLDQPLDSYLVY